MTHQSANGSDSKGNPTLIQANEVNACNILTVQFEVNQYLLPQLLYQ